MYDCNKQESCKTCVYFCGVYSPEVSTEYHNHICVVEHFFSLKNDGGAKQKAIMVSPESMCEMYTTKQDFDKMAVFNV